MSSVTAGGVVRVSEDEFGEAMQDNGIGFCRACGASDSGVEPDAERYRCEFCGAVEVYGAEQLLIMGKLAIEDGSEHGGR